MTIENCLAAKHSPTNGCEDKCKWPNACNQNPTATENSAEFVEIVEETPKKIRKAKK